MIWSKDYGAGELHGAGDWADRDIKVLVVKICITQMNPVWVQSSQFKSANWLLHPLNRKSWMEMKMKDFLSIELLIFLPDEMRPMMVSGCDNLVSCDAVMHVWMTNEPGHSEPCGRATRWWGVSAKKYQIPRSLQAHTISLRFHTAPCINNDPLALLAKTGGNF